MFSSFCIAGKWMINEIVPTPEGTSQKLKIKVRVNLHGIVAVASASLIEKKEVAEGATGLEGEAEEGAAEGAEQNGAAEPGTEVSNPASPDKQQSWTRKISQWFSSVRPTLIRQ